LTRVTDDEGNSRISAVFSDAGFQKEGAGSMLKEIPLRLFACGDLAFYHLILGREVMSHHWCYLSVYAQPGGVEGRRPSTDCRGDVDSCENMQAKNAENLVGADRKGTQGNPVWDAIFNLVTTYIVPILAP
jgi:hypothetical protein